MTDQVASMILQRRLPGPGGWVSVCHFSAHDSTIVQRAAELLSGVAAVWWRVVADDTKQQVLAIHDGRRWQSVADERMVRDPLGATHMPWAQPVLAMLRRRRGDFAPTIPVEQDRSNCTDKQR